MHGHGDLWCVSCESDRRTNTAIVDTADTAISSSLNKLSGSVTYCSSNYSSLAYEANLPVPDIISLTVVSQDTCTDMFNIHAFKL